jgi:hypothetical protein
MPAEWVATRQSAEAKKDTAGGAVGPDRVGHVVRTRRLEPAAASKIRRNQQLIRAKRAQDDRDRDARGGRNTRLRDW